MQCILKRNHRCFFNAETSSSMLISFGKQVDKMFSLLLKYKKLNLSSALFKHVQTCLILILKSFLTKQTLMTIITCISPHLSAHNCSFFAISLYDFAISSFIMITPVTLWSNTGNYCGCYWQFSAP